MAKKCKQSKKNVRPKLPPGQTTITQQFFGFNHSEMSDYGRRPDLFIPASFQAENADNEEGVACAAGPMIEEIDTETDPSVELLEDAIEDSKKPAAKDVIVLDEDDNEGENLEGKEVEVIDLTMLTQHEETPTLKKESSTKPPRHIYVKNKKFPHTFNIEGEGDSEANSITSNAHIGQFYREMEEYEEQTKREEEAEEAECQAEIDGIVEASTNGMTYEELLRSRRTANVYHCHDLLGFSTNRLVILDDMTNDMVDFGSPSFGTIPCSFGNMRYRSGEVTCKMHSLLDGGSAFHQKITLFEIAEQQKKIFKKKKEVTFALGRVKEDGKFCFDQ